MLPVGAGRAAVWLWGLVLAAVAARWMAGVLFPGFQTGDDVEIAESALSSIGALDYSPWPIRNQLLPRHLLGPVLGIAAALGVTAPESQLSLLRALFALVGGGLVVWLTYRLGLRLFKRDDVALLGAALIAFHPLALASAATTLPRVMSTAAVLAATLLVFRVESRPAARLFAAGLLIALAFACRYSEAIFLVPLLGLGARIEPRQWARAVGWLLAGFAAGALVLVGVEDWWVFGTPFHSLIEFARYTLVERQASSRVAIQPLDWYARRLLFWLPATLLPALLFVDRSSRAVRALAVLTLVPIFLLSLVHHKDLRYLQGVLPFVALLGAAGLVGLASGGRRRRIAAVLLAGLTLLLGVYRAGRLLVDHSNASVRAARVLAAETGWKSLGVTQRWAFGGGILMRDKERLIDLGAPPTAEAIGGRLAGLDAVAVQRRFASPELEAVLERSGFDERRRVVAREGDEVAIFAKAAAAKR